MILASQSPRRRELLGLFCPEFEVMPAQGEESLPDGISPREAVMLLSKQKAEEISARKFPDGNITDTIVAADTIVATERFSASRKARSMQRKCFDASQAEYTAFSPA